jgi:hypothetical protein
MSALRYATDSADANRAWPVAHLAARIFRRPDFPCSGAWPGHGHHRLGALAAGRQILLHILPSDPGFGFPVFGLHLYTWCFIAFSAQIAASAVLLIAATRLEDGKIRGPMTMVTATVFAFVVGANLVSVVAEAGFHWNLPADPSGYLLFR